MIWLVGVDEVGRYVIWRSDQDEVALDDVDVEIAQIREVGLSESEDSMEVDSVELVDRPDL